MRRVSFIPAIGAGLALGVALSFPNTFPFLLSFSIWGTSFPHTFGGFTRNDLLNPRSIAKALGVYLLVLVPILMLRTDLDLKWLFTAYFFWQQFHYARQTYGITKRENPGHRIGQWDSIFYLSTTFISSFCALSQGPHHFFNYSLENPFPITLNPTLGAFALGFIAFLYMTTRPKILWWPALTHGALYFLAFVTGKHFMVGWLALNLFHNLQYLELLYQENKGLKGFALPSILTLLIFELNRRFPLTLFLISLNFAHYIWDSQVWRSKSSLSPSP